MGPLLAGAVIASSAFSAWSNYQAGQQSASAYKAARRAKKKQAAKFMERFEMNAEFTRLEGETFKGTQAVEFAKRNVDIGSGASLKAFEDTARKIERRIEVDRLMAENQRDAILMDADLDLQRAKGAQQAGTYGAISSFLSGATKIVRG